MKSRTTLSRRLPLWEVVTRHWRLILEMARREHTDRYSGQVFGWTWAVIHPLFLAGVYVFIFNLVFRQEFEPTTEFPLDYTAFILAGLTSWLNVVDTMARTSTALIGRGDLLRQMTFPAVLLPIKSTAASLLTLSVMACALQLYVLIKFGLRPSSFILGPVAVALQLTFLLGVGLILSSLSVFLRDIKDVVQLFSLAGVYLIPAFYLPGWAPDLFRPVLLVNPFSHFVWCFQDAFFYGHFQHPWSWFAALTLAVLAASIGQRLFTRLQPTFGSML